MGEYKAISRREQGDKEATIAPQHGCD